jgi:putative zinc finger protein/FecR-like protein
MFTRHVDDSLSRYCDGELSVVDRQRVDAHLASCARCRTTLEEIQFSASVVRQLKVVSAPPSVWNGIERAIEAGLQTRRVSASAHRLQWALACVVVLAVAVTVYWSIRQQSPRPWEVARVSGGTQRMKAGELVETGSGSRARIVVGQLGTVDVAPQTRVRLGQVSESEYRLRLDRGTISAEINAPPRLFIVDTPASAVVDLGCAYTVTVADDGVGELRMTKGWSSLEWKGRESLVPAGAMCRTRPEKGPGTPYFEDASAALKRAVDDFDTGADRAQALDVIIREARVRDTLTLWHLLSRAEVSDRVRVYERIAQFEPPPAGASRDRILALDADALRRWREELAWKW